MSKSRSFLAFTVVAFLNASLTQSQAQELLLPLRETARPETTKGVPHVQIGIDAVPALSEELRRRVAEFPDVRLGPTRVSLPSAVGFQLGEWEKGGGKKFGVTRTLFRRVLVDVTIEDECRGRVGRG
jgi:hypothetical protein